MSGPLALVQQAIAAGARSRTEIVGHTGLDAAVVDAGVDHLVRMGRLVSEHLGSGCPTGGCGGCPSARTDGSAGCGASGPSNARGPVLLTLGRPAS